MHCVQLGQIFLCVAVMVVQVDGGRGGVTGLRYDRSERPGQRVEQVRPHDHILDQLASGLRSSHGHDAPLRVEPSMVLALESSYPGDSRRAWDAVLPDWARPLQPVLADLAGNLDQSGNTCMTFFFVFLSLRAHGATMLPPAGRSRVME